MQHQDHYHHRAARSRSKPRRPPNINTSLAAPEATDYPPLVTPPSRLLDAQDDHRCHRSPQRDSGHHQDLCLADASFLENPTSVDDADMAEQNQSRVAQRDSHDLSYSNRNVTRDSLVTNMLLSLDQFSSMGGPPGTNGFAPDDPYDDAPQLFDTSRSWANSVVPSSRHRQQSYSSDVEVNDDSSRLSSQTSRGRRSNSSSNFHNTYSRLNSVRESTHRSQPTTPRVGKHSRGGKESKSSSTNSVDVAYSQLQQQQRHARAAGRSASFDHGTSNQLDSLAVSPFQIEFSNSFFHDDYNAAPTPTIPSGPRRMPSTPAMIPPPPPPEPRQQQPFLERKRSLTRSLKSSSGKRGLSSRDAAAAAPAPALVSPDLDSAPAPHVGYEKSKDGTRNGTRNGTQNGVAAAPKEKPGFFRRVFGGGGRGKDEAQAARVASPPDRSLESSGNKNTSAPPSRDTSSSHSQRPTLQKKPSSFFRRRKKSTADQAPPIPTDTPPVPLVAPVAPAASVAPVAPVVPVEPMMEKGKPVDNRESVSSLREVMNPYLDKHVQHHTPLRDITNTTPNRHVDPRSEYKRDFSPDYEPSPNARIRAVQPDSDHERSTHDTPSKPPPSRPGEPQTRTDSFLNLDGGSDGDDDCARSPKKAEGEGIAGSAAEETIRQKKGTFTLYQTDSEEEAGRSRLALPIEGTRAVSPASASSHVESNPGTSAPPSVFIEAPAEPSPRRASPKVLGTLETMKSRPLDEPNFVIGDPTQDDRQKAQKIFDGNEDFISKEKAASWMGEEGPVRQRTLQAYMELYDFANQSVVNALRQVCGRLVFRAETQQVDRILVAFSKRWCDCNPKHGFKATDVIHMICYSIMLLNTDLHIADIEQKMTRSQFIKNTMTTISQAVKEVAPDAFSRPTILPEKGSGLGIDTGMEAETRSFRHSFRPPPRTDTQNSASSDAANDCGPLVRAPFEGSFKAWEEQVENVLKLIYASIRDERLPLYGAEPDVQAAGNSQSGLSVIGMLKRTPSVLSKAPSESAMSTARGRVPEYGRAANSRWASKSRSRPGMGRNGFSSSRTSFEEANSMWSPALSSATWSKYSLGRTHTSVSQDSFAVSLHRGDYQQSIGFANALSQAIIRNDDSIGPDGTASIMSEELPEGLLDDESLELAGPPWVKEGMVIHKHHLDGVDKKARDRNWTEVFAVIQKGQMSLFSFSNKSLRQKNRTRAAPRMNAPVGGGNWQDNATSMGTFSLRQTLASALPSPGYSRSRPHVWALSLPTGAVHLFQVGTPEIIKEFVTTVNYWSARLSTHPLVGGISNIEYGWGENIVNNSLVMAINESNVAANASGKESRPGSSTAVGRRTSIQSGRASIRSASFDLGARAFTSGGGGGKLAGDRIHIAAWAPPTQSMRPSNAREEEQLATLTAYVKNIEEDLQAHNQLRSPMLLAFTPRGSNANKAMSNWERKSAYLLREIVKYRTYVDCLQQAAQRRNEVYSERKLARKAARGDLSDGDMEVSGDEQKGGTVRAR